MARHLPISESLFLGTNTLHPPRETYCEAMSRTGGPLRAGSLMV